ncbi:DUF3040 domain-containing protein [Streptomyces sp. TN58]|uniref:DUF3040 domain-containing protein n=1 Tax=Streptomyces sp. TN58 TaxID=234612 RepID=UPI00095095EB|nr:DUF3040 domain-containing protein [Streptomyces sp. TN58]APU43396.1 hypothetical protein BSL84_30190 [Streptomyces sp. TN58]
MDEGPALSPRERKILSDIEQILEADVELQHTLSSTAPPRVIAWSPLAAGIICILAVLCLGLLVAAAATSSPMLIWCFALAWVSLLVITALYLRGWFRKRRARSGGASRSAVAAFPGGVNAESVKAAVLIASLISAAAAGAVLRRRNAVYRRLSDEEEHASDNGGADDPGAVTGGSSR